MPSSCGFASTARRFTFPNQHDVTDRTGTKKRAGRWERSPGPSWWAIHLYPRLLRAPEICHAVRQTLIGGRRFRMNACPDRDDPDPQERCRDDQKPYHRSSRRASIPRRVCPQMIYDTCRQMQKMLRVPINSAAGIDHDRRRPRPVGWSSAARRSSRSIARVVSRNDAGRSARGTGIWWSHHQNSVRRKRYAFSHKTSPAARCPQAMRAKPVMPGCNRLPGFDSLE
jgi:hypothetical protein